MNAGVWDRVGKKISKLRVIEKVRQYVREKSFNKLLSLDGVGDNICRSGGVGDNS